MKIAIVGAGPAGLAASSILNTHSPHEVFLFDSGKHHAERNHEVADDLGIGIGGAGLFSDGKFSFYPSGTRVYQLNNKQALYAGHQWICDVLADSGIESSPLPILNGHAESTAANCFTIKDYPSTYGSLEQRKDLINQLAKMKQGAQVLNSTVERIEKINSHYAVHYTDHLTGQQRALEVDAIILATGRLGNLSLSSLMSSFNVRQQPIRYEIGIRVETKSDIGFLNRKKNPDVKAIWKTPYGEIRTFCTCRNGEVWNIPYGNLAAISGRSDGPETNFSNFGLLLRFTGDSFTTGKQFFDHILTTGLIKNMHVAWQPLVDFLSKTKTPLPNHQDIPAGRPWYPKNTFQHAPIIDILGTDLHAAFHEALSKLLEWSPDLNNPDTMVLFPSIEGTGAYPSLNQDLKIENENIWCCGDLAGNFRGIIPAFLSGYYAADHLMNSLPQEDLSSPRRRGSILQDQQNYLHKSM